MTSSDDIESVSLGPKCWVTSAEFDVTTASADELALYGIPSRPDPVESPTAFAIWSSAFKKGFKLIQPELQVSALRHGPVQGLNLGSATSSNWAGAVITNYEPLSAVSVSAQWQVQWVFPAFTGSPPEILATWVGMDGLENPDVLQAGVDQIFSGAGETANLWYEWYPNPSINITNIPVKAGDNITCIVTSTGPKSGTVLFSVNGVTGTRIGFTIPGGAEFYGSSAEFIAERPTLGGNMVSLPQWQGVTFSQITTTLSDGSAMNLANNPIALTMTDDKGNPISDPWIVNSSTLTVYTPGPVKGHEKGPIEKTDDKGHRVIENLPIRASSEAEETRTDGSYETFITQRDRPMESE